MVSKRVNTIREVSSTLEKMIDLFSDPHRVVINAVFSYPYIYYALLFLLYVMTDTIIFLVPPKQAWH